VTLALVAAAAAATSGLYWEGEIVPLTSAMREEYERLYRTCSPAPERKQEIEGVITRIMRSRERYERVAAATSVPWYVIAVIHNMECSGDFTCHLHNGNPLSRRTVDVPAGRPEQMPASGKFPYTWEESAIDALRFDRFEAWTDWSIAGTLYKVEAYNGFGARNHGVHTPYLWGGSFDDVNGNGKLDRGEKPIYAGGKYIRDHVWDAKATSKQIGAGVLLHRMSEQALIDFPGACEGSK
jgi:lysozyme family protein